MFNIKMTEVKSSNLQSIGYNNDLLTLTVKFKSGGSYSYIGVEALIYKKLIDAESIGSSYHKLIKSNSNYIVVNMKDFNFLKLMVHLKGLQQLTMINKTPSLKQVQELLDYTGIQADKV